MLEKGAEKRPIIQYQVPVPVPGTSCIRVWTFGQLLDEHLSSFDRNYTIQGI